MPSTKNCTESPSQGNKARKEQKMHTDIKWRGLYSHMK